MVILLAMLIAGVAGRFWQCGVPFHHPLMSLGSPGPSSQTPLERIVEKRWSLCRRYLSRHTRHRFIGGVVGVLFAIVVGVRRYRTVTVGIGSANPLADVLFCGVAGVIIGAPSAEHSASDQTEPTNALPR